MGKLGSRDRKAWPKVQSETQTEPGPEAAFPLGARGPGVVATAVEFPLLKGWKPAWPALRTLSAPPCSVMGVRWELRRCGLAAWGSDQA